MSSTPSEIQSSEIINSVKEIELKLIHKSLLVQKEVKKREQLVQTYIVLFGLLLSYAQIASSQKNTMISFLIFMIVIMIYYSALTSYWFMVIVALLYRVSFTSVDTLKLISSKILKILPVLNLISILSASVAILEVILKFFTHLDPDANKAAMQIIQKFYLFCINLFALSSSLCLSFVVVEYFREFFQVSIVLELLVFVFLTILLSLPLLIHRDMLREKITSD